MPHEHRWFLYGVFRLALDHITATVTVMWVLDVQVRTVAAFGMEQGTVKKYDQALELSQKVTSKLGRQPGHSTACHLL